MVAAGGVTVANFTHTLLHFVPVVFPKSVEDEQRFLICARLLLVMVENRSEIFIPIPLLNEHGEWNWINQENKLNEELFHKSKTAN